MFKMQRFNFDFLWRFEFWRLLFAFDTLNFEFQRNKLKFKEYNLNSKDYFFFQIQIINFAFQSS